MKYIFWLFAIMLGPTTSAQNFRFTIDTVFNKVNQASYGRLRVIDMREDKQNIGELKTGAFNRTRPIITEQEFPDFLSEYYSRMLTGVRNENAELLFVLYAFEIDDRANGGEVGTFHIDVDVFGGINGGYAFLSKVDSMYEATSAWDVTQALLTSTKQKLNSLLARYASLPSQPLSAYQLTEQQVIKRRESIRELYPIYQTREFRKGIYYTVEQFLNNSPVDTPFIKTVVRPTGGTIYVYYLNPKGKRGKPIERDMYFSIFDGKDWIVSGPFFPEVMRLQSGEFYANIPFRGVGDKAAATTAGVILGGAIGGAIVGAAYGKDKLVWGIYKAKFDPETRTFLPQKRLR